jgi:hypothetical protein
MKLWAALAAVSLLGPALADEMPNTFMDRLFATYQNRAHWTKTYRPCDEFCEPGFAKLVKKLDYDPVCQCRSGGGDYVILTGKLHPDGSFEYTLRDRTKALHNRQWIVILKPKGSSWQIFDIWERRLDNQNSLRERLQKGGTGILL